MGTIISIVVINILGTLISNVGEIIFIEKTTAQFTMKFPIYLILLVAAIMYIIVSISVILPLRKIKKLDIISGIKEGNKKKRKYKKVPTIIQKLFKQEGELAYRYTKREKSRHITMVSSITISVVLFLVINGIVINFLENINELKYNDYKITTRTKQDTEKIISTLEENNLVNDYFIQMLAFQKDYDHLRVEVPEDKISDAMLEVLKKRKNTTTATGIGEGQYLYYSGGTHRYVVLPYYFAEKAYNYILEKAGITELKENECILLNTQQVNKSIYGSTFELTKYKVRRQHNYFWNRKFSRNN